MRRRFLLLALVLSAVGFTSCGPSNEDVSLASELASEEQTLPALSDIEDTGEVEPPSEEVVTSTADPNSIGFMTYYPQSGTMGALAGTNEVTIYFQKPDISAGIGSIELYDAYNSTLVDKIEVTDTAKCVISPIDDSGRALTDWVEGTKAELYFNTFFTPGASYYLLMDKGCFMAGSIASKGVDNASYIKFDTKPYGISGIFRDKYNFGDTATMDVILGGDAVRAAIMDYDGNIMNIPQNVFTAMGTNTFMVTFQSAGHASFRIAFYNSAGIEIDSVTFDADVLGTAGGAVYSDQGSTLTVDQATPTDLPNTVDVPSQTVNIQDNTSGEV